MKPTFVLAELLQFDLSEYMLDTKGKFNKVSLDKVKLGVLGQYLSKVEGLKDRPRAGCADRPSGRVESREKS